MPLIFRDPCDDSWPCSPLAKPKTMSPRMSPRMSHASEPNHAAFHTSIDQFCPRTGGNFEVDLAFLSLGSLQRQQWDNLFKFICQLCVMAHIDILISAHKTPSQPQNPSRSHEIEHQKDIRRDIPANSPCTTPHTKKSHPNGTALDYRSPHRRLIDYDAGPDLPSAWLR